MAVRCGLPVERPRRDGDPERTAAGSVPWRPEHIVHMPLHSLKPDPKNPRIHGRRQIAKLVSAYTTFGITNPLLIDENNQIIAGHGRWLAAKELGLASVPAIRISHLTEVQKLTLAISDNAMADASSWDDQLLHEALASLADLNADLELTGFDPGEIDFRVDGPAGAKRADPSDAVQLPKEGQAAVSREGDLWVMGEHRLLNGDALEAADYQRLLGRSRASLVFTDPPYGCKISGHVSGLGRSTHREFVMGSEGRSAGELKAFLEPACANMAAFSVDGSIHFVCMDWRGLGALLEVGEFVYSELKNIVVWVKTNAGMGSLYRSQHEFVTVYKHGAAPHINNVELGRHGRHRSNIWDYPGANAFGRTRDQDLAAHPTPKPIKMVADAIRDCSKRGQIVLDPFVGSGTTILACERTGRRAAAMELDPLYVDVAIRRWQAMTGKEAVLEGDGRTFEALSRGRDLLALEDHSSRGAGR